MVAMETPSPSLIIIWGKMARGLLPRVTPPPLLLPDSAFSPLAPRPRDGGSSASSSSSSSSASSSLSSTYSFSLLLHHLLHLLRLVLVLPIPSAFSFSADCFFCVFYSSSGFTSPSHRTAAPTLPASGILCLHLTGATV